MSHIAIMASHLPTFELPEAPQESTPPSKNSILEIEESGYDANTLSPLSAHFPAYVSMNTSSHDSSVRSTRLSPYSQSFGSSEELSQSASASENEKQPFNFTPQQYVVSRPPQIASFNAAAKQTELGRRRGHKYARSSVSHQIILSPTPRLPLQLPTSLPVPTFREFQASMTPSQRNGWLFCVFQLAIAACVQFEAHDSMSMTALSHLQFFDALSAVVCTAVGVGRNFEVWTRSSLRNPFGLERVELLTGLAMSIVLLFMGLDLISHGLTHSLENVGGHVAHHVQEHEHAHGSTQPGSFNSAALAAILSTLVSASRLGTHSRIGQAIRPSSSTLLSGWWIPEVLRSPSHVLALACATLLFALPLLNIDISSVADNALAFAIAAVMIFLGGRICYRIGRVLLMSFPTRDKHEMREVVTELWGDGEVASVDEAKIWQVHYGLCMANFKVKVRTKDAIERVREKIASLVRSRLAGEGGGGGTTVQWEISSMISVDRD
jgi:divalent metal cation (Fe/Co/Zn/Cd) transporter